MSASVFLGSCLLFAPTWADERCAPLVPEVAADVTAYGLPSQAGRWAAAERLWSKVAQNTSDEADEMLAHGSLSPVADLIQGRTHDLLREAILHHRDALADSLLALWLKPLATLSTRTHVKVYYTTPQLYLSDVKLKGPTQTWVGEDGVENVLYSAIYLAGAIDIVKAIALRPRKAWTAAMTEFTEYLPGLALQHYMRWAFGPPAIWQVRGWGCDASGLDLVTFTRRRLDRDVHGASYCTAPTSVDLLLAIGIDNLLDLAETAPELVPFADTDRARLQDLLALLSTFIGSRITYSETVDDVGRRVETMDFDPGTWSRHDDFAFAAHESPDFPAESIEVRPDVGWDFSHGARIAWAVHALGDTRALSGLAHQLGAHVLDDTLVVPRFKNYLNGSNGWYRVMGIAGQRTGVPPFGLSFAFLSMPWALLADRDPKLRRAMSTMWKVLASPSEDQCTIFRKTYARAIYRFENGDIRSPLSERNLILGILPFVAISPLH